MKFRKRPVVIDATQWFKPGDHPLDAMKGADGQEYVEGKIVRFWRQPHVPGVTKCEACGGQMADHGFIDTLEGGHRVCPGDWIITGVKGEHYPCKPDIFEATYEPAVLPRPTIAELETILEDEGRAHVSVLPSGEVELK